MKLFTKSLKLTELSGICIMLKVNYESCKLTLQVSKDAPFLTLFIKFCYKFTLTFYVKTKMSKNA